MEDILFDLYYKQAHRNEELEQTIEELQDDLKQARNKIKLLNKQIDRHITTVNDLTDIAETSHKVIDDLKKENSVLKLRLKMITKGFLNCIYGLGDFCFMDKDSINDIVCYMDTGSIKETKDNDDNN